jgi:26S proteasome regulatory subunit N8
VIGILLGTVSKRRGEIDVTNSFALPFDEDARDPSVFFADENFAIDMDRMFRKVSGGEKIVGWYSTAKTLRQNDSSIHGQLAKVRQQAGNTLTPGKEKKAKHGRLTHSLLLSLSLSLSLSSWR